MKLHACLPCLPALSRWPACLLLTGGGANTNLMGKRVSRGQQRPWTLGKTNQSNPVTGPLAVRSAGGVCSNRRHSLACSRCHFFFSPWQPGSLSGRRLSEALCFLYLLRTVYVYLAEGFWNVTNPASSPPATSYECGLAHTRPSGKQSPSALAAGDSVSGNSRLVGNIRLTVSLSQGNVPPSGRLCQCGAVVVCWWRVGQARQVRPTAVPRV